MSTDLIYVDESFTNSRTVVSAMGIRDSAWKGIFDQLKDWRLDIRRRYGVRIAKELHASPLLAGRGRLGNRIVTKYERSQIFFELLRLIGSQNPDYLWIINACLAEPPTMKTKLRATERVANRVQRCLQARGSQGILMFDEGLESQIRGLLRRLRAYNPIPSMFGKWEDGADTKNIVADRILADPVFVESHRDYFIQAVDFVAHSLLKREEPPTPRVARYGLDAGFTALAPVLNRKASWSDPDGIVR